MNYSSWVSTRKFALLAFGVFGVTLVCVGVSTFTWSSWFLGSLFQTSLENSPITITAFFSKLNIFQLLLLVIFVSSGILLLVYQFLLKHEAIMQKTSMVESPDKEVQQKWSLHSIIDSIPSVAFLEICTFTWVGSFLLFISSIIFFHFDALISPNADLRLSAILFGLLGGSLANMKFFVPSAFDGENGESTLRIPKEFSSRYTYKYLSTPFISSLLAFIMYLGLQAYGMEMDAVKEGKNASDPSLFALIFIISGYYSEQVFTMMYRIVQAITRAIESKLTSKFQTTH